MTEESRANLEVWAESERRVQLRALQLAKGQSPYFNLAPLMELIRHAYSMGYELVPASVVRKPVEQVPEAAGHDDTCRNDGLRVVQED